MNAASHWPSIASQQKVNLMTLLRTIPLKIKLPLIVVGLSLMAALAVQVANTVAFKAAILQSIDDELKATTEARRGAVLDWFAVRETALVSLAASPATQDALRILSQEFALIPAATEKLKRAYITENPNPIGQKQLLDAATGPEGYHAQHARVHPYLRKEVELNNFYDIFLFDRAGNVVYTNAKEADFATNFDSGPYASTTLGKAQRQARQASAGEVFVGDIASYAPSNGDPAGFLATPVFETDGRVLGVLAVQFATDSLSGILEGPNDKGDVYLLGEDNLSRSDGEHPTDVKMLQDMPTYPQFDQIVTRTDSSFDDVPLFNGGVGFAKSLPIELHGLHWGLVMERNRDEAMAPLYALYRTAALILAVMAALILGAGVFFARSVTRPLAQMGGSLDAIAAGTLGVEIAGIDRTDELGAMAKSLGNLQEKLVIAQQGEAERAKMHDDLAVVIDQLGAGMQDLSAGDLTRPITDQFDPRYDGLRTDFNATLERLSETITQVVASAHSIRARSTEISTASEDLSRRTENQAAALEETAAALDELTSSVRSAADGAREVETIVGQARKEAEESGEVVQGAVAAMAEIEKSSEMISQIIGAIDDIAFQTNLLALNAGVEAARAGDAGKGFAVVASEVRALAQRSSAAAKEIKTLISTSAQHVGRGVDQVGKAGEALHNIVGSVANISTLVSNIAAGATEQSTGLAEINIGVTQLDQVTQQNAAMVEQATAASTSLHQDASALTDLVSRFVLAQGQAVANVVPMTPFHSVRSAPPASGTEANLMADPRVVQAAAGGKGMWQDF
jgi:methyl-accepting chemotaxis protein